MYVFVQVVYSHLPAFHGNDDNYWLGIIVVEVAAAVVTKSIAATMQVTFTLGAQDFIIELLVIWANSKWSLWQEHSFIS